MYNTNQRTQASNAAVQTMEEESSELSILKESVRPTTYQKIDEAIYQDFEKRLQMESLVRETKEKKVQEAITLEQAVQDFQDGISEAFDYLYGHYKPIFDRVGYRNNDQDLPQELSYVLLKAVQTFEITGGAKFNTYYWKCARNHMGTLKIRKNAKKRTSKYGTVSMQQSITPNEGDTELGDFVADDSAIESINNTMFKMILEKDIYPYLKDDEVIACKMIQNGYTLEEIGKRLGGITAPAVYVKFKRLANKKNVGKQFKELYSLYKG